MDIRKHFEYAPMLDLTAANIGITKWDWVSIDSADEGRAREIMKSNRFDVLPIVGANGQAEKFFSTCEWGKYENLNCTEISDANTIYYRTSFNDLISKFRDGSSHFYFLANNKEILGLVSYVNLDCSAVYNYLYQIVSDLERVVAKFLSNHLSEEEVIDRLEKTSDKEQNKIAANYRKAKKQAVENSIFHHFYLQTTGIMLSKFKQNIPPLYQDLTDVYQKKFLCDGCYGQLRNKIMHPVRPILSDQRTIFQIDELLTDYPFILEIVTRKVN